MTMDEARARARQRVAVMRAAGLRLDAADEARIVETTAGSIAALAVVTAGSLFDTEPANFDRLLLAERQGKAGKRGGGA
jgi:hypothetical protein